MNGKITISTAKKIARDRGGECLSSEYRGARNKMRWKCGLGHIWEADLNHIKNRNSWCPHCAGKAKKTIEQMRELAGARNGKCLSLAYVNVSTKLTWECSEGHIWDAVPNSIQKGVWCPVCAGNRPLTLKYFRRLARERNGTCLSTSYENQHSKMRWECVEGHRWVATAASIQNGSWCPRCNTFLKEEICRSVFEHLFNKKFPKQKPTWLLNSRGNRMELDGFCEELGIAFEYNGEQHFQVGRFSKTKNQLIKRILDDNEKYRLCGENNVKLFLITYEDNIDELKNIIFDQSNILNIDLSNIDFSKEIVELFSYKSKTKLEVMREMAEARGGWCISTRYLGSGRQLEWKCSQGHVWAANPNSIQRGSWCPICAGNQRKTIEDMHELANKRGGKCLSSEYLNSKTVLEWMCSKGHRWKVAASGVISGAWCKRCASLDQGRIKRTDIQKMHEVASERGGRCLSSEYVNARTKLSWECARGHKWDAKPDHVVNSGSWCPTCRGKRPK